MAIDQEVILEKHNVGFNDCWQFQSNTTDWERPSIKSFELVTWSVGFQVAPPALSVHMCIPDWPMVRLKCHWRAVTLCDSLGKRTPCLSGMRTLWIEERPRDKTCTGLVGRLVMWVVASEHVYPSAVYSERGKSIWDLHIRSSIRSIANSDCVAVRAKQVSESPALTHK